MDEPHAAVENEKRVVELENTVVVEQNDVAEEPVEGQCIAADIEMVVVDRVVEGQLDQSIAADTEV
jgi:hypothetical protein